MCDDDMHGFSHVVSREFPFVYDVSYGVYPNDLVSMSYLNGDTPPHNKSKMNYIIYKI